MSDHQDRDDARFDEQGNTRPGGSNYIVSDASDDGLDRRGFLKCMAWAGTATVWGLAGGIPTSYLVNKLSLLTEAQRKSIFFVQVSDSHIGFNKEANKDVTATAPHRWSTRAVSTSSTCFRGQSQRGVMRQRRRRRMAIT